MMNTMYTVLPIVHESEADSFSATSHTSAQQQDAAGAHEKPAAARSGNNAAIRQSAQKECAAGAMVGTKTTASNIPSDIPSDNPASGEVSLNGQEEELLGTQEYAGEQHAADAPPPFIKAVPVEYVEIVDAQDRPFMVMPVQYVHDKAQRQPLAYRIVLTILFNNEQKVYLQRRAKTKQLYPGKWELSSTGHVMAGESREDAAIREVREELNINVGSLVLRECLSASEATDYAWITLFAGWSGDCVPRPNPQEVEEGMFVDREELFSMVEHFPELCTPAVLWATQNGYIFPHE